MRLAHHLTRRENGVFCFRLVIPADLRSHLGLRVLKRSLGTRDAATARAYAYALGPRYAAAFAVLRGHMPKPPIDIDAVLARVERGEVKRFEITTTDLRGRPLAVKTDGSAADNAAAVEAKW